MGTSADRWPGIRVCPRPHSRSLNSFYLCYSHGLAGRRFRAIFDLNRPNLHIGS